MWRENGGQTNGHEESEKSHHGNERGPFLNKSHFGVKLSWAKDEALRSPPTHPMGTFRKHQMRFDVSAVEGSVVTWKPPHPHSPPPPPTGWLKVTLQQLFELRLQQVDVGGRQVVVGGTRCKAGGARWESGPPLSSIYYINGDPARTSIKLCKAHREEQPHPLC